MSLQAYYDNKQKARELYKRAIKLKYDNPDQLPKWKLNSRINALIMEMNVLGYNTTIEDIGIKADNGKVYELENLKLLHEFTEVLKLKTTSIGYVDYWKIYNKLASMEMGDTCKRCKGTGIYKRSSGVKDNCSYCNGTGWDIEVNESLLNDLKQ